MIVLTFNVTGNNLRRTDTNKVVSVSRNNVTARFEFNSDWENVTPLIAQFSNNGAYYDTFIENGECTVPWEVLENEGTLSVAVSGGDLITTNAVKINVYGTGIVGGLTPTTASPGVYSDVVKLTNEINADYSKMKSIMDTYEDTVNNSMTDISELAANAHESEVNAASSAAEAKTAAEAFVTDTTLSVEGRPADAMIVGSEITSLKNGSAIEDNAILPAAIKPCNFKLYKVDNKTEYGQSMSGSWVTGTRKVITANNPLKDYTDAYVYVKLKMKHNHNRNIALSPTVASNGTNAAVGTITVKEKGYVPVGDDFTETAIIFYINGMPLSGTKNIIIDRGASEAITYELEVLELTIIPLAENEVPDTDKMEAFREFYSDRDYIIMPEIPDYYYQEKLNSYLGFKDIESYKAVTDLIIKEYINNNLSDDMENAIDTKICSVGVVGDSMSESITPELNDILSQHNCSVTGYGVGGETAITISARIGAIPIMAKPFTLKADGTKTNINIFAADGRNISLGIVTWGYMNGKLNPVTPIGESENVKCIIEYDTDNSTYTIRKSNPGGEDIVFERPTAILAERRTTYKKHDVLVFWLGTNGGYEDFEELADQIRQMADYCGTDKFIVLNMWLSGMNDGAVYNKRFGRRFLDIKKYCVEYGYLDAGYSYEDLTDSDKSRIEAGNVPSILYRDSTHPNPVCDVIIAKQIYIRGKELGYWK